MRSLLPGQPVPLPARAPAPQLGPGVYEKHGVIRASLLGPPRFEGSTLTVPRVQPHTPIPGSIVIGFVTRLSPLQALISITVVDGVPLPAGEEFTGVIRSQDVRATEKDRVKIGDSFRGGDVVRTQVISLGDARSYFVTTARNDLGVIFATSEAGKLGRSSSREPLIHDFKFHRSDIGACIMAGDAMPENRKNRKEKMRKAFRYAVASELDVAQNGNGVINSLPNLQLCPQPLLPPLLRDRSRKQLGLNMTAVLSATDALRKDRHISLDDNNIGYSSNTDWREKYNEVLDMLSETRTELDEFHQASKELEAELESELQRTEKSQQELQTKVARAEHERDEWKGKFISLQTTHNTTTTSLQRELDQLRQEHQKTKVHLRELEMGNDDLERNERAVSSSLADMEAKYSKALEEKILLEHELLEKAALEEDTQRLKDELRDANVEISILKDQLKSYNSRHSSSSSLARTEDSRRSILSTDDLLQTTPPSTIDLNDILPPFESPANVLTTPKASLSRPAVPSPFMPRVSQQEKPTPLRNSSNMIRSTLPSFSSPSTSSPRTLVKPPTSRNPTSMSTTSSTGSVAKNKGVQMVSDMRARVRNLEQKIHTRVPRLRMVSITGRQSVTPSISPFTPINGASSSSSPSNASTAKTSLESQRKSAESRLSNDSGSDVHFKKDTGDSSGWVLIMEDSPSPQKEAKRAKEKRRISNPNAPTAFRPTASAIHRPTSPSLSTGLMNPMAASTGLRRPISRLSGGTSSSASSASRPQTPTFLPKPSSSTYAPTSSMKRSTGPGTSSAYNQLKRSSLGKSPVAPVPPLPRTVRERPITMTGYPKSTTRAISPEVSKALPGLPDDLSANVTIRPSSRVPSSSSGISSISLLSKSRIGRPSGGFTGRKSGGGEPSSTNALDLKDLELSS
ncbi:hypothetical protein CVT25_002224 [Psilocybe cyanescens]|uniref:S1 motif domain-containing protein n=1 Tax=Psilocybe cyanescens TaxID=93625 RepID=A0A409XF61_PSICY|nr:hypothetical protein CVT25_002224 [Psilocybe cyanescens]